MNLPTAQNAKMQSADPLVRLLDSIHQIQLRFIDDAAGSDAFEGLLAILLNLTDSGYGFIAEVLYRNDQPYLKARAITNIAWNEETRALWERESGEGLEFHNLSTLYGAVLRTGEPVLSDDPATDPRRGGLATDHPPLTKFLGLPIHHGEELIGMIGLANRKPGYDQELVDYLEPIVTTCSSIFSSIRADRSREEAERKMLRYRKQLEDLLAERTTERDLSREQLIESERLAYMGTLTAGIAHQINNPTGAILTAAQFALSTIDETEREQVYREALSNIEREARRCGEVVRGLLEFSRNRSAELTDINVGELTARVAERLQTRAKGANIRLRIETPTRNVRATTNELELEQVVTNIIENTFVFGASGSETMVRCAQAEKEALIIIEDDGPGIPEENLDQIFQPFYTTRGERGGTGLGLSLAEKLIRGHHGTISASNRTSGGARFEIRLPRPAENAC